MKTTTSRGVPRPAAGCSRPRRPRCRATAPPVSRFACAGRARRSTVATNDYAGARTASPGGWRSTGHEDCDDGSDDDGAGWETAVALPIVDGGVGQILRDVEMAIRGRLRLDDGMFWSVPGDRSSSTAVISTPTPTSRHDQHDRSLHRGCDPRQTRRRRGRYSQGRTGRSSIRPFAPGEGSTPGTPSVTGCYLTISGSVAPHGVARSSYGTRNSSGKSSLTSHVAVRRPTPTSIADSGRSPPTRPRCSTGAGRRTPRRRSRDGSWRRGRRTGAAAFGAGQIRCFCRALE